MKVNRGEARATDLDFLPPTGHATGLTTSVLWTFPLTILDPGRRGDDIVVALGLGGGAGVPVGGIFRVSWTGGEKGSGCKISEWVKKRKGGEGTD